MMDAEKRAMLIILDGWGIGQVEKADAIKSAHTPFVDSLYQKYPNTTLTTFGEQVGLPNNQMGNSEVGHLNLGAGRIVYQDLEKINVAIRDNQFKKNQTLNKVLDYALQNNKTLHILGLVSDGGVHSHILHFTPVLELAKEKGLTNVLIHAFTDGRDTDPKSGYGFIESLQKTAAQNVGKIATVTGRYYAMDRDKRWDRVKLAYDALVKGIGTKTTNILDSIQDSYNRYVTDEFILPIINENIADTRIQPNDAVLVMNFRTDRCREITEVLTQKNMPAYDMVTLPLEYATMTRYDDTYKNVEVLYDKDNLNNTIGEVVAAHGKTQLRVAETEKYPHVTFFFSGGREQPFTGEERILVASPKVATYDLQPEMSAAEVTDKAVAYINANKPALVVLNYANADMVGHTGVWNAVVKAAETVDLSVEKLVQTAIDNNYTILILADHGNGDYMINDDGTPNTAHTKNPVPLFLINYPNANATLQSGKLADIAPTLLHALQIPIPTEMTGTVLINENN